MARPFAVFARQVLHHGNARRVLRVLFTAATLALAFGCRKPPPKLSASPTPAPVETAAPVERIAKTPLTEPTPSPHPSPAATTAPTNVPIPAPTQTPGAEGKIRSAYAVIQAEDYDAGGEGVGWHDTSPGNMGGGHRLDDVDIDGGKGVFVVSGVEPGEWLNYTLDFPRAGPCDVDFAIDIRWLPNNVALALSLDGKPCGGMDVRIRREEDKAFARLRIEDCDFPAGVHTLRTTFERLTSSLDSFEIVPLVQDCPTTAPPLLAEAIWADDNTPAQDVEFALEARLKDGRRWRSRAVSDAAGRAQLSFCSDETSATLRAVHRFALTPAEAPASPGAAQPIRLMLRKSTAVFGRVVMKNNGGPVAGAEVRVLGEDIRTTSDAKGEWTLPSVPGAAPRIAATKGMLCSFATREDIKPLQILPRELNGPIELQLREGAIFEGQVCDEETSAPLANAELRLTAVVVGEMYSQDRRLEFYTLKTGADGWFHQPGLFAKEFTMEVDAHDYAMVEDKMTLGEKLRIRRDYALEAGAVVTATVHEADGRPATGARVMMITPEDTYHDGTPTDAQGVAVLRGVSRRHEQKFYAMKEMQNAGPLAATWSKDDPKQGTVDLTLHDYPQEYQSKAGAFAGRVTEAQTGQPLEGVRVTWDGDSHVFGDEAGRGVLTDKDGRYALSIQHDGRYASRLTATPPPPFALGLVDGAMPGPADNPAMIDFALEPGAWLAVTVTDETGKAFPEASVDAHAENVRSLPSNGQLVRNRLPHKTDGEGKTRFEQLRPPTVEVDVSAEGMTPQNLKGAAVNRELQIKLVPAGVIRGRVVDDATDKPVPKFRLEISGDGIDRYQWQGWRPSEISDEDGQFRLETLWLGGAYALRVSAEGWSEAQREGIVASRSDRAEEVLIRLRRGRAIEVAILDAETRAPVAQASVYLELLKSQYADSGINEWSYADDTPTVFQRLDKKLTGADGLARFVDGDPPGTLLVKCAGYQSVKIAGAAREAFKIAEGQYAVPVEKGIVLRGTFKAPDGSNPSDKDVYLDVGGARAGQSTTDGSGAYAFKDVRSGFAEFYVSYGEARGADNRQANMQKQFEIGPAPEQTVDFGDGMGALRLGGTVLRDGSPMKQGWIELRNRFGWEYSYFMAPLSKAGQYQFMGLKPGEYVCTIVGPRAGGDDASNTYLQTEVIRIGAENRRDFEIGAAHKISARLVFPEGMDSVARARWSADALVYAGTDFDALKSRGQDATIELKREGDALRGVGRARGPYKLYLRCAGAGGNANVLAPGVFDLDTLERDQDLGEVKIPEMGVVTFKLTYARREDAQRFSHASIRAFAISAPGDFYFDQTEDGRIAGMGLAKGEYGLALLTAFTLGANDDAIRIPGHWRVDDPLKTTDWGEVVVYPIYKVNAKLRFANAGDCGTYRSAWLKLRGAAGTGDEAVTRLAPGSLRDDGAAQFAGLFMGKYALMLGDEGGPRFEAGLFELNNAEADQDLGEIPVGSAATPAPRQKESTPQAQISANVE